ncbi:thioredoxin family protein [uncultured Piscinibacter sp.]|uniref:thioredoxin family protein n=1 Tax=uncultured Piscinibacter sp. TaxID=1131835 RepID=UPI00261E38E3|nr:thioredoxin family protein [uncultured Piscinibacter sp.]
MSWHRLGIALVLAASAAAAVAGFPARYAPTSIPPAGTPQRYEFDLSAALQRAQRENKRVYLYLGANDCAFCRKYEAFLEKNAAELVPHFAKEWIVYEMRSSLSVQADRLFFRIGDKSLPYADFMRAIGDERARQLVYPSVWLLDPQGKPLMQMPAGTGTFETVLEQLEILRLEE